MDVVALGKAFDKYAAKKWAIIATDYSSGHDAAEAWTKVLEEHGQQPAETLFAPLGTTDFGSQISKLESSGADGVFMFVVGSDAVAFIKQADQFGLFKKIKTRVGQNTVSEPLFKPLGDSALGVYNNVEYVHQQETGDNEEYAAAYKEKFGENPYYIGAENYIAAQTLFAGVEKAKSVDPEKVKAALKGLKFSSLWGDLEIRPEDNQLMAPSNVAQVVKEQGGISGLGWKVVSTTPASETSTGPSPDCKA
jgi:branched-chain amino acid transport system substrate-binding protein